MKNLIAFLLITTSSMVTHAQTQRQTYSPEGDESGRIETGNSRMSWGRDTTRTRKSEVVPIGVKQWRLEERLGTVIPAANTDTIVHLFQFWNDTQGLNGEYSFLGNLGSPRISRIFQNRSDASQHLFLQPYDFFLRGLRDFRFTNTLSPITNLAYHKVGNNVNGHERVRANFASNINKQAGIGFKLDYLYGRGYYNNQANSQFGGTLFGYYLNDRYNMHAWVNANHSKTAENGGIENDTYITNPQSFPQRYGSKDIPTTLSDTWNRNDNQTYYLTQRYHIGFERDIELPDSLKPKMPHEADLLLQLNDSLRKIASSDTLRRALFVDSLRQAWTASQLIPQEFIPVSSIIHTLQIDNLHHTHYAYTTPENYYTKRYYGTLTNVRDQTNSVIVRNTLGLAMVEGFNKWAAMGITLFATHDFRSFSLPELEDTVFRRTYREQNLSIGGELSRTQGSLLHYNVSGELTLAGKDIGQFKTDGRFTLSFPLGKRDTLALEAHGFIKRLNPGFYFRHYHSQFAWWDHTNLSKEFKTRIGGTLRNKRTRTALTLGMENIQNYTYFSMQNTLIGTDASSTLTADYSHEVTVKQHAGSIQVFMASLKQDFKAGPLHWDNEVTYQTSSNEDALPLPVLNLYSNLYLAFRIARVLNVELGADCRYFTSYYAPDYAVNIGQFAVQDAANARLKIGNYPIINAYANLHLKRCRLYAAVQHVNAGNGRMFWAPHYAMNPMTIHFGISWNFFN